MMSSGPPGANGIHAAGGYGPPGGGYPPPGGGYPPPGGGYGGPPPGGYGGPPPGGFGGGGFGGPPGGGFGTPGGFPPPGGPMMPGAGGDVNTTLPLVLSIIGFLFCCLFAAIPFLIAFIFTLQANSMKGMGDIDGAQQKAKTAMTLVIVGFVVGVIQVVLVTIWNFALAH